MTDIEQKALALVREVLNERNLSDKRAVRREVSPYTEALCRAIEQHEAFKQEVSDAVTALLDRFLGDGLSQGVINGHLHQFIIRKPDPLVEVLAEVDIGNGWDDEEDYARQIHKALEARGLEIRSKNDV